MAEEPKSPGGEVTDPRRDRGVALEERHKVERPPKFRVVLYNDDYTPMEFVVALLEQIFHKSPSEATALMLQIHRGGFGVAGVYVQEIAETRAVEVHHLAEEGGYPLRAGVEPD